MDRLIMDNPILKDPVRFSQALFEKMSRLDPATSQLELYEFRYALGNITPEAGWQAVHLCEQRVLVDQIQDSDFYSGIQLRPLVEKRIVLDPAIQDLTQTLFVGLVMEKYSQEWIDQLFYFDIRAFVFFPRTQYYTPAVIHRFSDRPYQSFPVRQENLLSKHEVGYKEFKEANSEIDSAFITLVKSIIKMNDSPIVFSLVGPSGAGKTEITQRLRSEITKSDRSITTIELDNFLKDGEFRDGRAVNKDILHYEIFKDTLGDLMHGKRVFIPQYDFLNKRSSHDLSGHLRSGRAMLLTDPAQVIFLEGNLPLHIPEIAPLAGIKIVYLTDDPIRLKRKWHRDIDTRKKYDPVYFCNRFFRTQHLRAQEVYRPMLEICDILVDTTRAQLWVTPSARSDLQLDRTVTVTHH